MQEITHLLQRPEVRLLTLTGTGGVGKTRLALSIAATLQHENPERTCFFSLAGCKGPSQVAFALAQALGVKETDETSLVELLKTFLAPRRLVLILDNFEHILAAAPLLRELLEACPQLKLLITSRAALRLSLEYEYPVAPLPFPDLIALPEQADLAHYAAVALFVQRAQMVRPAFQLTAENGPVIAEICARLDGLPLAIELAAARIKLFTPQMLLKRLNQRLLLLVNRTQDRPARHQTLRANLDWSYHLLSGQEQRLFRRLAVFGNGCTFQAIEGIYACAGERDTELLDDVMALLENSLLTSHEQNNGEVRFSLLETIREYAWELLEQSGEQAVVQQAHASYFLHFMELVEPELEGNEQSCWMKLLELDYANTRAGLCWLLDQRGQPQGAEEAVRLASALAPFWKIKGALNEGRTFLEQAFLRSESVGESLRARVAMELGRLLCDQGDFEQAEHLLQESLTLARPLQLLKCQVVSLNWLGHIARTRGNYPAVHTLLQESLRLARPTDNVSDITYALNILSAVLSNQGDYVEATRLAEESLWYCQRSGNRRKIADAQWALGTMTLRRGELNAADAYYEACLANYREVEDEADVAYTLTGLGFVAAFQEDYPKARACLDESIRLHQAHGNPYLAGDFHALGRVAFGEGKYAEAYAHYQQSLSSSQEFGDPDPPSLAFCLEGLGEVVEALGYPHKAACLLGYAEQLRQSINSIRPPFAQKRYETTVIRLQAGTSAFADAWRQGTHIKPESAYQLLAQLDASDVLPSAPLASPTVVVSSEPATTISATISEELTEREVEIFRLLAEGLTKPQIAERLIISFHTVNAHVRSIYAKVGVSTRSAATRYALEHHLV